MTRIEKLEKSIRSREDYFVFRHDDPDLDIKISKALMQGSGYLVDFSEKKAA